MPQSARLSAGGGVQWLFGQCPNEQRFFYGGASLSMSGMRGCTGGGTGGDTMVLQGMIHEVIMG